MSRRMAVWVAVGFVWAAGPAAGEAVRLTVDPGAVEGRIDERIYSHFLEHIYHSVNGGLWGELVWNRSFERVLPDGRWEIKDGQLHQTDPVPDVRLVFGDRGWRDGEFSLQACKTGGYEGFLILFRYSGEAAYYWLNLGGWGNRFHALEKATDAGRTCVTPQRPGRIETGRWYRIRVRFAGPRFQAWLDDEQVLDFTDEQAHPAGAVGVGTWTTTARFRDLAVRSPTGETLFEGLPAELPRPQTARDWEPCGRPARLELQEGEALNGRMCLRVEADGEEGGILQRRLAVREGQTLHGSLWARGETAARLTVRLTAGERVLAEEHAAVEPGPWKELNFTLRPSEPAEDAALAVVLGGRGRVWIDQVSLMPDAALGAGGFRPDLLEALAGLRPPLIRWPGGCFAEWYRWKDAIGPQHKRISYPIEMWDDRDVNAFGIDEFIALCRRLRCEPLVVINIGRHDVPEKQAEYVREACDWVEYCNGSADSAWGAVRASRGRREPYGVRYWEIDNETWSMGAEAYGRAVRAFVPAMKQVDPSIRIVACGSAGTDLEWNRRVLEACAEHIDWLSLHHYEPPEAFASQPAVHEAFFRQCAELIAASRNPSVRLFVSEWNAQSTDWRTGLYAGGLLNVFERCGDVVEISSPALLLRHVSATEWDNALINFDHRRWFPAPNYVVMKLWRDHFGPRRVAVEGARPPLNVVASCDEQGRRVFVKLVNPAEEQVEVELTVRGPFTLGTAAMSLVAADSLNARNTLDRPDAIRPVRMDLRPAGNSLRLMLPRWSAGVVEINASAAGAS